MKKTAIILLITALAVLCFASCGREVSDGGSGNTDNSGARTASDYNSDGKNSGSGLGNAAKDVTNAAGDMIEDGVDGIENGVDDLLR